MTRLTDDERALLTLVSQSPDPVVVSSFFPQLNPANGVREGHPGHEAWLERTIAWYGVMVALYEKNLIEEVEPSNGERPALVIASEKGRIALGTA